MRKSDLQNGMVVEFRNGQRGMIVNDFITSLSDCLMLATFQDNLKHKFNNNFDIIKIYNINKARTLQYIFNHLQLIWERQLEVQLTEQEINILSNLEPQYKYIARDLKGALWIYEEKPEKNTDWHAWESNGIALPLQAFEHLFTSVQFENEYPVNINNILEGQVD